MGIASDLRQSVLQAAIQGKLTAQKAEDGNARDLLREIRAEKEKLVKEKKIKKEKILASITDDEIPFDIPDNWVWCRLENIINIRSSSRVHQSDWRKKGIPFYRAREIVKLSKNGYVDNELFIDESLYNKYAKTNAIPQPGDIMVSGVGTLGASYIVRESDKFYYKDASVLCFENRFGINPYYLNMMLKTPFLQNQIYAPNAFGTTVATLTMERARKFLVPLPPLAEQHRIVERVDGLKKEIDKLEKTEKELEAIKAAFPADMKASLLQAAMEGKLTTQKAEDGDARDLLREIQAEKEKLVKEKKIKKEKPLASVTEDEIPFDIPDNWVWCRLNDIVSKEIRRGKSPKYTDSKSNTLAFAQKCNTKYDGIQMSLARYLDESTLKRYTEEDAVIDGDTIINSTGHGTLGRVGFFTESDNPKHLNIYPDSHVTIVRPSKSCEPKFINLYIKTQQSWLETKGEGSTNQTELKPVVIKSLVIPLPPLAEQHRIVEKLDQLLPLCDSLSKD